MLKKYINNMSMKDKEIEKQKKLYNFEIEMMEKTKQEIKEKGDPNPIYIEMIDDILNKKINGDVYLNKELNKMKDDEINVQEFLRINKFLILFNENIKIEQHWVDSVERDYLQKRLKIGMREVIYNGTSTIQEILKFKDDMGDITLQMLDAHNKCVLTYQYSGCKIEDIKLPYLKYKPTHVQNPQQIFDIKGNLRTLLDDSKKDIEYSTLDTKVFHDNNDIKFCKNKKIDLKLINKNTLIEDSNLSIIDVHFTYKDVKIYN